MAYNQAYGAANEMNVLGTSSFMIASENTLTNTSQKDIPHRYETLDSIRNRDPPPPYTQAIQPEDQASSGIYETIPEEEASSGIYETIPEEEASSGIYETNTASHLDNANDEVDYIQML